MQMIRTYRVYFRDGNQRMFESKNMWDLLVGLNSEHVMAETITKIEEIKD